MATRKRHTRKRRHVAANPRPRRRRSVSLRRRASNPLFSRRRRSSRVHHRRRRRNPARISASVFVEGGKLAIAGALIGIGQPILRGFVGQWIGTSPIAAAALTFGTGYALSFLAGLTSFTKKIENALVLSGATIAAAQLLSAYVWPLVARTTGGAVNPTMSGMRGMRGIGVMTGIPPGIVPPPPPPPQAAANGMNGIGVRPGNWAY